MINSFFIPVNILLLIDYLIENIRYFIKSVMIFESYD